MTLPGFLRSLATAVGLVALTALAIAFAASAPAVVPASADASAFSADRAMTHIRAIAQRPHPGGTADHARVRAYILSQLEQLGVPASVQEATGVGTRYPAAGRVRNIVGVIPGTTGGAASQVVLLMAHYDGVPASPAAGDDGSGSAVLLEVARALRSSPRLRNDVLLLFTDGEEAGLLGAAAFIREHPLAQRIGVTMSFEARGTRGPSLMFETGPGNLDVARMMRRAPGARATSLSTAVYRQLPNDTDLSEVAFLARPALNFAFIGGAERYHTSQDDVAHLDGRSVQHHGNQALALTRAFGDEPLPRPITGDGVFFDLPAIGVIVYPESWAMAIAAFTFALVVVLVARSRRADPRGLRGIVVGAAGALAGGMLAGGVGMLASTGIYSIHGMIGDGSPTFSGVYLAAVALLAFGVASGAYALARRWAGLRGVLVGAVLLWGVLGLVTAAIAPGVSFLFAWPALAGAGVAFVTRESLSGTTRAAAWVAALVCILILAPTLYLMAGVALGLGAVSAVLVSVVTALAAFLLAPLLESLSAMSRWFAPLLATAAALVLVAIGAMTVRHDPSNPTRASLAYALDADRGAAWLGGLAPAGAGRQWIGSVVAAMPRPGADSSRPEWLPGSYAASGMVAVPPATLAAPEIEQLTEASQGEGRVVSLRVVPPRGAIGLSLTMSGATVDAARIGTVPIDGSRYRQPMGSRWRLDVYAPPDTGVVLDFELASRDSVQLSVIARLPGLPSLGAPIPQRPAGVLASQNGDITLIHRRARF